jgi:23S rRNA pseudouridine1911/1915/1917 synthase
MVAKTDTAHRHLSQQLKEKTARREYIAIAQGVFKENQGTIDAPIGRDIKNRDKMGITSAGRPAVTHWRVLSNIQDKFSLVRLKLETGRTHQIRVHMASIGHPLLNDPLYGTGLGSTMKLSEKRGIRGQLLQAIALGFIHPISQEPMRFASEPSAMMSDTWDFLGGIWPDSLE